MTAAESTPTTSRTTPALDVLSLLSRYESLRASADAEFKSSIWNITKARRVRGGSGGGGFGHGFGGAEYSPVNWE